MCAGKNTVNAQSLSCLYRQVHMDSNSVSKQFLLFAFLFCYEKTDVGKLNLIEWKIMLTDCHHVI